MSRPDLALFMEDKKREEEEEVHDINSLYDLIRANPNKLKEIDEIPFVQTPLHNAAKEGKNLLVAELMSLMPSYGRKLNCDGESLLHVALKNGHHETARVMIGLDGDLVRVPGKEKITPLHYLVSICNNDNDNDNDSDSDDPLMKLLVDFLMASPDAVGDETVECKTALHVAVDRKLFNAFQVLLGWVTRTDRREIIFKQDLQGNNVLHLAVLTNQLKVVKTLECKAGYTLLRHQENKEGHTPVDMKVAVDSEIKKIFTKYPNSKKEDISADPIKFLKGKYLTPMKTSILVKVTQGCPVEMREMLLVVAVLVATAAYQGVLQPPGGLIQVGSDEAIANTLIKSPHDEISKNVTNNNDIRKVAGKVVMGNHWSSAFMTLNNLAFNFGIIVLLITLPLFYHSLFLHLALICLTASYVIAFCVINTTHYPSLTIVTVALFPLYFLIFVFHMVRIRLFIGSQWSYVFLDNIRRWGIATTWFLKGFNLYQLVFDIALTRASKANKLPF